MSTTSSDTLTWHRILDADELPAGRVIAATVGTHSYAVSHVDGRYGALDNRCPHQGGPLGEGAIEGGRPIPARRCRSGSSAGPAWRVRARRER